MQYPLGPTHPGCTGCMTARRCAKVLVGGFQVIPGQHACRGGQTLLQRGPVNTRDTRPLTQNQQKKHETPDSLCSCPFFDYT